MTPKALPTLLIVTPYLAGANNGNWRTAERWARLLQSSFRIIVQDAVEGAAARDAHCLIALHARRSHPAIVEWQSQKPTRPLIVALTGTDLYRDLPAGDADAHDSLARADALIVLQPDALRHLPDAHRGKASVVMQSAPSLKPLVKPESRLNCVMVGHLREEKDPLTALDAWRQLPREAPIFLRLQTLALLLFMVYQTVYWSWIWKPKAGSTTTSTKSSETVGTPLTTIPSRFSGPNPV